MIHNRTHEMNIGHLARPDGHEYAQFLGSSPDIDMENNRVKKLIPEKDYVQAFPRETEKLLPRAAHR